MASGDRLKSYKTKGNVEEGRRRREEEGVQLRKARRDEQIAKRRNLDSFDVSSDRIIERGSKEPTLSELANDLLSPQPATVLSSATCIRKLLAKENPPIAEIVEFGIIPLFVEFLSRDSQCTLQFESCWILTNIASGSSLHTGVVLQAGAVPALIRLLQSPFSNVREQAVWALGNIAGDNVQFRDVVLDNGILDPILLIYKDATSSIGLVKNATWTLSNLCRGKNPPINIDHAIKCLPVLSRLLYYDNQQVISDACWALSFLADGTNRGYIASSSFLESVWSLVKEIRDQNPSVKFVCDPVMGDNGAMYVPRELLPIYRDKLIPLADIVTPNQYEAELLSEMKINSIDDAKKVMKLFHEKGVKHVVLTSLVLPGCDDLVMLASEKGGEVVGLQVPKKAATFTGTGDLFTALYLAWSELGVKTACERALSTMQAVLKRTLDNAIEMADGGELSAEHLELRLIQSKQDIEKPPTLHSVGITIINC